MSWTLIAIDWSVSTKGFRVVRLGKNMNWQDYVDESGGEATLVLDGEYIKIVEWKSNLSYRVWIRE